MHSTEMSLDQAITYRDFVRFRHDERLRELAWWMSRTGGPIDAMDGSLPSLDALADWAFWFVGMDMPTLPYDPELLDKSQRDGFVADENSRSGWRVAASEDEARHTRRKLYLNESLTHYLLEVVRRSDSSCDWDVCPEKKKRVPTVNLHATGIRSSAGWRPVQNRWAWFWRDRESKGVLSSDFFAMWLALSPDPRLKVRADSVLTRYLDKEPTAPLVPPRFQPLSPDLAQAVGVDEHPVKPIEDVADGAFEDMAFGFAVPRRYLERPEKWKALPLAAVVAALADLGVHGTDGSISAAHLVDGAELARHDDVITATVAGAGGKARALWFEVHNMRADEWDAFHSRMTFLAKKTGARFCTDSEFFGDDDDD